MKYLPQLDGLRALAVLLVFAHHAFQVPLLWMGVDLFFILSGYLITSILLRDRDRMPFGQMLRKFYLRRAERILPAYIVALCLIVWFFPTGWHALWGYYVFFLQNVPYAFGMIASGPLTPLWSLAVEQHFYFIWPVLLYFLPRRWLAPTMVAVIVGSPILRALCTPLFARSEPIYALTPFRLDAMAAGALAAIVLPHCKPEQTVRLAKISMLVAAIAYVALGVHPWFRRPANTAIFNGLAYSLNIMLLGGLFVWAALQRDTTLTRILSNAALRGLGRISYMFYLLHLMVLALVMRHLPGWPGAVTAFAATTVLATVSWFVLEKPILSLSAAHRRAAPHTPASS